MYPCQCKTVMHIIITFRHLTPSGPLNLLVFTLSPSWPLKPSWSGSLNRIIFIHNFGTRNYTFWETWRNHEFTKSCNSEGYQNTHKTVLLLITSASTEATCIWGEIRFFSRHASMFLVSNSIYILYTLYNCYLSTCDMIFSLLFLVSTLETLNTGWTLLIWFWPLCLST